MLVKYITFSLLYKKWIKTTKQRICEIEREREREGETRKKKLICVIIVVQSVSVSKR
jgi:hypothetical protein